MMKRSYGYAVSVIALVALGVAAGAVLYTVYKGALLDPWPYEGGERLLVFRGDYPAVERSGYPLWSAQDYDELRELERIFDHVIAGRGRDANLAAADGAQRVRGAEMTPGAFSMLGTQPEHGRTLIPADAEPGASPVVLIGHALWQRRYGGDPGAVGQTLSIDGTPHVIVGVMPPRFLWWGSELWLPLAVDRADPRRDARRYVIQARLREGVEPRQANAALTRWARDVENRHHAEYPEYRGWNARVGLLVDAVVRDVREVLVVLLAAVVAMMLVAGVNVANLLLARAAARRREFAVRTALGASMARIARALIGENLVLTAAGAVLGLGIAWLMVDLVAALIPFGYMPAEANLALDWRTALIGAALAGGIAVLAALPAAAYLRAMPLMPALHAARSTGSRATARLRSGFVVAQLAIAAVIISGAIAVGTSFRTQLETNPGFDRDNAVKLRVALPREGYPDRPALRRFALDLEVRLDGITGVDAAGIGQVEPLGSAALHSLELSGRTGMEGAHGRHEIVGGDWFGALGIPTLAGRTFDRRDRAGGRPVAVVNETFARTLLREVDPVGVRIRAGPGGDERDWLTIVGVVGDMDVRGVDGEVRPLVYQPLAQSTFQLRDPVVVVRGDASPAALASGVRRAVAEYDPGIAVHDVATLDEIVRDSLGGQRLAAWVLTGFALAVTVLAALGIYGIVTYVTQLARPEYGLRIALGAGGLDIAGVVGRRSFAMAATGIGIGMVLSAAGLRVMAALLAQPLPGPLPVALATAGLLAAVVVIASSGPAWNAARTDPARVLREE